VRFGELPNHGGCKSTWRHSNVQELQGRVQLPEHEAATATGTVTIISDLANPGLYVQRHSDRGLRR
jgi:hypothetical protein